MAETRVRAAWQWWEVIPVLLILPAYFMNLGLMPLWADEPTRALVALEMDLSGNYLAPTILSDWYLNKPPLYNWILLGFYRILGYTELATRLPAMVSLIAMTGIIYWAFKKEVGHRAALAAGLTYLAFGRMAWYSSHLGHIDPLFADLVFFNMIWMYRMFRRGAYWALFLVSYAVTAVAFLMKGLPALVFQALTLLILLIDGRKIRKLFHPGHVAGIALFCLLAGSYYYAYFLHNISPLEYWDNLVHENVKRTALDKGFLQSLIHVFRFPVDQLFLFLPFSLFLVYLFSKSLWTSWWKEPFMRFTILIVAVNLPVYWLSPDVRPRYLFMLYPFIFLWFYLGYEHREQFWPRCNKFLNGFLGIVILLLGLGIWAALWFQADHTDRVFPIKIAILSAGWILTAWSWLRVPAGRYFMLITALLIFKLAVQWVVLPYRYFEEGHRSYKEMALQVGAMTKGSTLYLIEGTPISHATAFYITRERQAQIQILAEDVLVRTLSQHANNWVILDGKAPLPPRIENILTFHDPWRNYPLYLGKIPGR